MEYLIQYALFLAKIVTVVVAIGVVIALVVSAGMKNQGRGDKGHLEVTKLNDKFDELADVVKDAVLPEHVVKLEEKDKKKRDKEEKKKLKAALKSKGDTDSDEQQRKRVFVLDFVGDIKASATDELRETVTAVLSIASDKDEVVVRLESPGGMVHSYGLASSQLKRVTSKGLALTVCVDKVAASGGYMMACVGQKIVSAPFAIIGSIGVVAQLPNFHRLLKKHDVDYEMLTAGEYKRTLTMFGENTEKGREKFVEDLEDTHVLFKDFIAQNREQVDVEAVATGETWFGSRALEKNLVDAIETSDQYLLNMKDEADIFEVAFVNKKSIAEKLGVSAEKAVERAILKVVQSVNNRIFS
ncbi:protease SohB [Agarilytica rhodophyticola]|uniref:protease SohB n=1 Tax=Agarilytica rhodophyticola TaxID=1737490 RepID=UPI000B344FED|nr:protease SohB [Agarilytica rhodophyticola]